MHKAIQKSISFNSLEFSSLILSITAKISLQLNNSGVGLLIILCV